MSDPLQVPRIRRRIESPFRLFALLFALAAVPLLTVLAEQAHDVRQSVLHIVITFVALMAGFRLLGKRELGQLSPFELVTLMLIPEILSGAVQGESKLLQSLAGLCTILGLVLLSSILSHRFEAAQKLMDGSPALLVLDGKLLVDNLNRERITPDELFSEMRKQGLGSLSQVRVAVLESSGNLTFVPLDPDDAPLRQSDD